MAHAAEQLERAEHVAHGGHHGGHHSSHNEPLPMWVGITMSILGVLLAFSSAKLGTERTELINMLVQQQHAHAKYQAQDIKHRAASLTLRQLHAENDTGKVNAQDALLLAQAVDRYLAESKAAKEWVDSFNPAIDAHIKAQEEYELAQLACEFGIVLASVALLLKRRLPWLVAALFGVITVGLLIKTYRHTHELVHNVEAAIEENSKHYRALREAGSLADSDQSLVDEIRATYGAKTPAPAGH